LIVAAVQSSIILLMAFTAHALFRRQSAAVRHVILTAGLVTGLVIPALAPLLPSWTAPDKFAGGAVGSLFSDEPLVQENVGSEDRVFESAPGFPAAAGGQAKNLANRIWLAGVAIGVTLILVGLLRITLFGRQSKSQIHARLMSAVTEIATALRLKRRIRVVHSERGVLGTWGILQPRIVLPTDSENWSDDRLRIVLTHEIAHIKRFDWLVQMLAEFGRAFYWFNPLFWVVCRRLRSESEHACDDVVLNAGIDGKDYAGHLLEVARTLKDSVSAWSPVLAMAQMPSLERRFLAMLNPSLNHRSVTPATVMVVGIIAIFVTFPVAAMRAPQQASKPAAMPAPAAVPIANTTPAIAVMAPTLRPPAKRTAVRKPAPEPEFPARQGLADGSLFGVASDSSGAALPGVTVTVSTVETAGADTRETPVETIVSDETGTFQFRALTPGEYSLKAELLGFAPFRKRGLRIASGQVLKENIVLSLGTVSQRVEVTAAGQPRPPQSPGTARRIRIGGNVVAAKLASQVKPIYPQAARDAGIEGTVHLHALIGTDGTLIALRVTSNNDQDLANAALEAVRQWRYTPALLNNQPIEVFTEIDVAFKLAQ
jgi:TonB family protein